MFCTATVVVSVA